MKTKQTERGQVLVFIVLAIVAIFGFAALAVDLGRVYAERRRAQNAADAAAYAAAFAATQGSLYRPAGISSTTLNGYDDTDPTAGTNAPKVNVEIYNPPISGKYSVATASIRPELYYQVLITSEVDKIFSQFVYNGPLIVTVEAIVFTNKGGAFANGAAVVATCETCCGSITITGTGDIHVVDGNIVSNSAGNGKENCDAMDRTGTACIQLENAGIATVGDFDEGNKDVCKDADGNVVPTIYGGPISENSESNLWNSRYTPPEPSCAGLPTFSNSIYNNGQVNVIQPGIYKNGISISGKNTVVQMKPGMYCMDGNLTVTSGSLVGDNVMIAMRGTSKAPTSVNITTSESVNLSAPGDDYCIEDNSVYNDYCWSGFLFFMPYTNYGAITIAGGNSTSYTGTIYAPGPPKAKGEPKCKIVGNSENFGMNASLICYTVELAGTGNMFIKYWDNFNAKKPAIVELSK